MTAPLSRFGKIAFYPSCLVCAGVVACFSFAYYAAGPKEAVPDVATHPAGFARAKEIPPKGAAFRIRVLTLNLAHGRRQGFHQLLEGREEITSNLQGVAAVLRREEVDIAGLQEADGPCFWSGGFDHVDFLAEAGGFAFSLRGEHVKAPNLSYGTAILSRYPLENQHSVTFSRILPSFPKGFVAATLFPPSRPGIKVDLVSVHLDFLRSGVRNLQADMLVEALGPRRHPMILMGDFNADWNEEGSPLPRIAKALDLHPPPMVSGHLPPPTFPTTDRRIDWILASAEFEFESYRVLPDVLSDHRAVMAILRLRDGVR